MKLPIRQLLRFFKKIAENRLLARRNPHCHVYNFNKSNPLGGNGERVDIHIKNDDTFDNLDMYQKNHLRRYEFASTIIREGQVCADFACGTGYGSVMLSKKAKKVIGADINLEVVLAIQSRYMSNKNVQFINSDLLNLSYNSLFDTIISFETIEHFNEKDINTLLSIFNKSLKANGKLIISTPYIQERSEAAMKLGHHLTFSINEEKITKWLFNAGFVVDDYLYQNYHTHMIEKNLTQKDIIICIAKKQQTA